ncbi:hypothetical protein [Parabacteroides pacaensis]|uniref:hypothetical protein n=1 Tax=Parabacteroides pacaensis TaxID=2086575 RepID=UPI00131D0959|nr:hypothetical protein [Parabacteroides pacaensis]
MNCKKMNLSILLLGLIAAIIVALPGCKDSKKDKAPQSLAEKMAGKWNVEGTYEKKNGEWVSISAPDDAGWYDFRTDGTVSAYQRTGGKEQTAEMEWSVDETTGEFSLTRNNNKSYPGKVVFESDDRLTFLYPTILDSSTGEPRQGEFKDVLLREKK